MTLHDAHLPALPALQRRDELIRFLDLITQSGAKTGIEIGAAGCGTAVLMSHAMGEGSLLVSIDLPESENGTPAEHERICAASIKPGSEWQLVRGRSTADATVSSVRAALRGRPVDLLLIDAEHTEAAALGDRHAYMGFFSEKAICAFHDICMPELWPMWNRLRGSVPPYRSVEIIDDPGQVDSGLGILIGR